MVVLAAGRNISCRLALQRLLSFPPKAATVTNGSVNNPGRRLVLYPILDERRSSYHELSYSEHGEDPVDVLQYMSDSTIDDQDVPPTLLELSSSSSIVRVQMIHVPWNPADVNTVQGRYGSPYPSSQKEDIWGQIRNKSLYFQQNSVVGNEGWGRVTAIYDGNNSKKKSSSSKSSSKSSSSLSVGSLVTVGLPGLGTIRSSMWVPQSALLSVPDEVLARLGPNGCTLFQVGGTALRLLTDFRSSSDDNVVIQNAGNSAVGLLTSQLGASSTLFDGTKSVVSIVRRGNKTPRQYDEMVSYLMDVGKNLMVVAEEDLLLQSGSGAGNPIKHLQHTLRDFSPTGQLPKLALNAVGGDSAKLLLKLLDDGGTMVTYGGMSGKPIQIGTPQFIFKDIRLVGYWHSRWMVQQDQTTKQDMINTLCKVVLEEGIVCPSIKVYPLQDFQTALQWQSNQDGAIRSKLVWDCRE